MNFSQKESVVISGLPATGKTTLLHSLESIYGDSVMFLPEFLEPFPDFVQNAGQTSQDLRISAQKWVIDQHARKVELAMHDKRPVIMERGIEDALAYGWALGDEVFDFCYDYAQKFEWLKSQQILLNAPVDVIRKRLLQRPDVSEGTWDNYWKGFITKISQGYEKSHEVMGTQVYSIQTDREQSLVLADAASYLPFHRQDTEVQSSISRK